MSDKEFKKKGTITPASAGTAMTKGGQAQLNQGLDSIFDQFRSSFDDLMKPFLPMAPFPIGLAELPVRFPVVDIVDQGDRYAVTAELPGFSKDQVDVQVNRDGIQIRAEMKKESGSEGKNYLHRERAYSAFMRSFAFPDEVSPSKVEGSMKDGVLELVIPKKEPRPEERMQKVTLK